MVDYNKIVEELLYLPHPYRSDGDRLYQNDLNSMVKFDEYLGCPSKKLNLIHVAGTNGKGSCVSFLNSALMGLNYTVGTYQSPHISDCRERIKINGKVITKKAVCDFWSVAQGYINGDERAKALNPEWKRPPYSEVYVAMALYYFAKAKVDFAIIEVGIGGRLDPTNIIKSPLIAIICSIGLDHTKLLGETEEEIALEKCGIIKYNSPLVVGSVTESVKNVIKKEAQQHNSPCYFVDEYYNTKIDPKKKIAHDESYDLKGNYQKMNLETVVTALHLLRMYHPEIIPDNLFNRGLEEALRNTAKITHFRGRWEVSSYSPYIITDICDNEFGLKLNMEQLLSLREAKGEGKLYLILGFVSCDYIDAKRVFPKHAEYIFTCSGGTMNAAKLQEKLQIEGKVTSSVKEAIDYYWTIKEESDLVYIGGSVYLLESVFNALNSCIK